ncbi:MAG: ABC transporter substrate-binding protein [Acholeplasmataceae bacterium]|jgi:fructooligosaccharide transport system substrate-binding protein
MIKRIFSILIILLLGLTLIACDQENGNGNNNDNNNGNENNTPPVEKTYDLGGIDFVIRANVADRIDPRNEEYERMYRNEKIANIARVEEKYNIKVKYVNYPPNASWGAERDNWIIQSAQQGLTDSHVFEVTSNSVANLAVQGAILPLDDLIEKYGNPGLWAKKRSFGTILGKSYVYDDTYSQAEEGIYYNSELLGLLLGEERKLEPTKLWAEGKWTWEAFSNLAHELNEHLDHKRSDADGGPQYVMGGRTYDWFYPMVGTNGGTIVDSNFQSHLTDDATLETMEFLNSLRSIDGMWIDNPPRERALQPEFTAERVVFHAGADWYLTIDSHWGKLEFDVDFVPFPIGPKAEKNPELYSQSKVKSEPAFVISSAFSKERIPEGYENMLLHDELIFKIWSEIIHFPDIDPETGESSIEDLKDNYYATRLMPNYAHEESRQAHLDVWATAKVDHFYSISESQGFNPESFMIKIEDAIVNGDIRQKMTSINQELQATLNVKLLGIE